MGLGRVLFQSEVRGDLIPALASFCKIQLTGFFCLRIVFLKSKTHQLNLKDVTKLTVTGRDKIVASSQQTVRIIEVLKEF